VADSQAMNRILLLLKRSDEQETALQTMLQNQQDKSSPSYHQWLTPEQFGSQFGPADTDIQAVTDWLTQQGFTVNRVYSGKTVIEFSGSAGQVQQAFGTAIHSYAVNGKMYSANANDPQIPAALAPVVTGVVSLNNFPREFYSRRAGEARKRQGVAGLEPLFTFPFPGSGGSQDFYAVGPADFATIYNSANLIKSGNDGTGQTIAIVGETNINVADVKSFRSIFGLPANFDTPNVILNGEDPGITSTDEEGEADLDTQWSGAVAPGATVKFVVSASTPASAGIDLSALYIVEENLAGVMSESYGACEQALGTGGNAFYKALWEQAAAQGITVILSAGDGGSAGCDNFNTETAATQGLAVSGLASTPFNVSVGGTDFDEANKWSTYWSTTNDPVTGLSAKGYIPEIPWNENCAQRGLTGCGSSAPQGSLNIVGGSGGKSAVYSKPAWQMGINGMPTDNHRAQPDISMFASPGFDGSGYIICQADQMGSASCNLNVQNLDFLIIGGTSASAPAFAGVMALVNQYQAAHGGTARQGNANFVLYPLSKKTGASCTSSATEAATCIYNDVTHGNSALTGGVGTNSVPCQGGSPNCSVATSGPTGVLVDPSKTSTEAWTAGTGYDMATGLGTVNVGNLVTNWGSVSTVPTTTTLTLSPTTGITHGSSENVSVKISVKTNGSGTPGGDVALIATLPNNATVAVDQFTLDSSGNVNTTTDGLPGGASSVIAHYTGDGTNAPSDSAAVPESMNQETSQTFIVIPTFDSSGNPINGNATSVTYGSSYILRMYVTDKNAVGSPSGPPSPTCDEVNLLTCPTGTVTLTDGGTPIGTGGGGTGVFNLNGAGYTRNLSPGLTGGTHTLVARYSGDNSYKASNSATTTLTVMPATMQLSLQVPTSTVIGVGTVIYMSGRTNAVGVAPMGTLSVYDGTTLILSASGSGLGGWGGNGLGSQATAGFAIDTGIFLTTLGSHSLTMSYSGDPNYTAVTTNPQIVQVVYPTTMQLQSNAASVNYGSTVTLTATVNTTQANPPPTGQITFTFNTGQGTIVTGPTIQTVINGFAALQATATVTLQSSASLYANYSGDSNYSTAQAYLSNVTVNPPDFSITPSQPGLTITAGQSASLNLVVTPTFSLNSPVQFQIPTPVVQGITCSVSPSQIQLSGGGSVTATLTCSVPAPSSSTSTTQLPPSRWPGLPPAHILWRLSAFLASFALILLVLPERLHLKRLAYACALLGILSFALGCGGGSGGGVGGGGGGGGSATPTTTTLTVPSTKVSTSNLQATVQVSGGNSPTGSVSLGVVGESYSFNTATLVNGAAQYSYYLGAPGAFLMTAQYSGDSRNLPSQVHTPLTVVQTGMAGTMTTNVTIGLTFKQTSVTLTIQ